MSTQYSAVSQIPNLGRAWSLTINNPPNNKGIQKTYTFGSQSWTPETMRIVFEVNITGYASKKSFWTAKIELYNLAFGVVQNLLYGQGAIVQLSAGFQNGPYGVIFQGTVYQVMYERVEVVDSKVTLICYTGLAETIGNFASIRGQAKMTQAALIAKMASGSNVPFPIDPASQPALSNLPTTEWPRARAFFGDPHDFIDSVMSANNLQSWYGFDGLGVTPMTNPANVTTITYTPTTGILGTPQQTLNSGGLCDGVQLVVLLDPRLRVTIPPMQIDISSSIIRQFQYQPPNYQPILDPNGTYLVNGLQFRGDSRGNQWETEIIGLTTTNGLLLYIAANAGTPGAVSAQAELDRRAGVGGAAGQ